MRRIIKTILETVSVLIVLGAIYGVGYYVGMKNTEADKIEVVVEKEVEKIIELPGEVEKRLVTVEDVESKLSEIAELSTYAGEYTVTLGKDATRYFLDDIPVFGTTNSIEITCSGIVKVGYDMNEIKVKVDDDKIYISFPEAKLNDNYVIWDTVECSEKNNILNPIEFAQYDEIVSEIVDGTRVLPLPEWKCKRNEMLQKEEGELGFLDENEDLTTEEWLEIFQVN